MRKRSLKQDMGDDSVFRGPSEIDIRNNNMSLEMEYHMHCPHFFTLNKVGLPLEGIYRGRSIFLICNGPSFAGLNHELLKKPGIMTFGINNGAKSFRPNFWTCVDDPSRFLKSIWMDPKITKFVPFKHFVKPIFDNEKWEMTKIKVGECPNVIGYMRNEKFIAERFLVEDTINWGNHTQYGGGRSVLLPAIRICHLLGFRNIYLLGCDLKMTSEYAYHFDEKREKGAVNCNNNTYKRLKEEYLPGIKPFLEKDKCFVYNCNPDSELKTFPFVSFEKAISDSCKDLGDVENERVYGLYSKPGEKDKWKKEPPKDQKVHLKTIETLKGKIGNAPGNSPVLGIKNGDSGSERIAVEKIDDEIAKRLNPILEKIEKEKESFQQKKKPTRQERIEKRRERIRKRNEKKALQIKNKAFEPETNTNSNINVKLEEIKSLGE